MNVACTGRRKLVLGGEGIFLHYLPIHNEGRNKISFKVGGTQRKWKPEVNVACTGSECYTILLDPLLCDKVEIIIKIVKGF